MKVIEYCRIISIAHEQLLMNMKCVKCIWCTFSLDHTPMDEFTHKIYMENLLSHLSEIEGRQIASYLRYPE
jgi:hypothetical protein